MWNLALRTEVESSSWQKTTMCTKNNLHEAFLRVRATRQTDSDLCPYAHWGMFYIKFTAE